MLGFGVGVGGLRWMAAEGVSLTVSSPVVMVPVLSCCISCILQSTSSDMAGMPATLYTSKLNGRRRRARCKGK